LISSTNCVDFIISKTIVAFLFQFRALVRERRSSCGLCPRRRKTLLMP